MTTGQKIGIGITASVILLGGGIGMYFLLRKPKSATEGGSSLTTTNSGNANNATTNVPTAPVATVPATTVNAPSQSQLKANPVGRTAYPIELEAFVNVRTSPRVLDGLSSNKSKAVYYPAPVGKVTKVVPEDGYFGISFLSSSPNKWYQINNESLYVREDVVTLK